MSAEELQTKTCTKCQTNLSICNFYKQSNGIMGVRPNCKECEKNRKASYWHSNKEECVKSRKLWQQSKPKYYSDRKKTDVQFKLVTLLRTRLCNAIRNNQKAGSAISDLGCSIEELKSYLESLFQPGMAWSNWTKDGWHIDHIIPISSFDLCDREQVKKACHYSNLQPLWARDNMLKSDNHPGSTPLA